MIKPIENHAGAENGHMLTKDFPIVVEIATNPVELANAREQDERFKKNWAWFMEHAEEIYKTHRGKCLCIAGQKLFVGDTPAESRAKADAAYPEDNGRFSRYIPRTRTERIYAH